MARINPELLERLISKLGLSRRQVYSKIQEIAATNRLERHLAALMLAWDNRINIEKYSSAEERALLRGATISPNPSPPETPVPSPVRRGPKPRKKSTSSRTPRDNSVFVVHGRNEELRKSLFAYLRALGLKPMEWSHAVASAKGANPYIGEILDSAMARVQAVVVLLSPDDEVRLKEDLCKRGEGTTEGKLQGQARPNVLFEAGLALGRHPEKTLLIEVGNVKAFSDIAGKHMLRLNNTFNARNELANRLEKLGCKVDRKGADWASEGDFDLTKK